MNVQENSDKSLANSKKEANLIRKEAELQAQKLLENARRERDTMSEEVITLKTQKLSLIARLRHVLTSQLELMDVLELDDMDISKLRDRTKKVFSAAKIPATPAKEAEQENKPDIAADKKVKPESDSDGKENESNLFKDVFGDDMETLVK